MPILSKSRLLSSRQCAKRVWLEVHRPELREDSGATAASFVAGNEVGAVAREIYDPGAVGEVLDVRELGMSRLLARTRELLSHRRAVFEAGFSIGDATNGALSLADVLLPEADGVSWRMVEIKSSASVKHYHVEDAAIQFHIATQAGLRVSRVAVAHIDSNWTYAGGADRAGLLVEVDVSEQVRSALPQVAQWITTAHEVVASASEPDVEVGDHCSDPFDCSFRGHCDGQVIASKGPVEFPVHWLPDIRSKALKEHIAANGVRSMDDVQDDLLNERQIRVKQNTLGRKVYFDQTGAARALAAHSLPALFLDFETIAFAVPRWAGTRPYQQIPFQFSLHRLDVAGQLTHSGFLDLSGGDPSHELAKSLVARCDGEGPIFAYNMGFEGARCRELAERFPELSERLLKIADRLVDLLPIAREHFYHPDQQGSWSIKKVLPAIAPDLDYSQLEGVRDGGQAQQAFLKAIASETPAQEAQALRDQLLAYCSLDTFAMVRLWSALRALPATSVGLN